MINQQPNVFDYIKNNYYPDTLGAMQIKDMSVIRILTTLELCKILEVNPCVYSLIYNGKRPVNATLIIKIHECTGMPIALIKSMLPN